MLGRSQRGFVAVLLALLVFGEGAGIARAMCAGGDILCCCGPHAVSRACKCAACPIKLRRTSREHDHGRVSAPADCHGAATSDAPLVVLATMPGPVGLPLRSATGLAACPSPSAPPSPSLDLARPPP